MLMVLQRAPPHQWPHVKEPQHNFTTGEDKTTFNREGLYFGIHPKQSSQIPIAYSSFIYLLFFSSDSVKWNGWDTETHHLDFS